MRASLWLQREAEEGQARQPNSTLEGRMTAVSGRQVDQRSLASAARGGRKMPDHWQRVREVIEEKGGRVFEWARENS